MAPPNFRKTQEWESILEHLKKIISKASSAFNATYGRYIAAFAEISHGIKYISAHRMDELYRSCADDLYRYATYHDVKAIDGAFSIAQFVEAAYLSKWISTFHPIIINSIDKIGSDDFFNKVKELESRDGEQNPKSKDQIINWYRKSNEIYNIFVASHALCKTGKDKKKVLLITDFLKGGVDNNTAEDAEAKDFMYALRYRLKHQDVYRPIYRRIHESPIA